MCGWPSASLAGPIIQRFTNFMPLFPHAGKNDAVASYSDSPQVMKFSPGNNVESAAELRQMIQDGEISVGLYGKAQSVRHRAKATVQLVISVFNRRLAVHISRRPYFFTNRPQRDSFAKYLFDEGASRLALLPREVRREGSWIRSEEHT